MLKKTIKTLSRILTVLCVSLILLTSMTMIAKAEGENTELPKESYTVRYLELGTNRELAPTKTVTDKTVGTTVTEQAIDIDGYTIVDVDTIALTIKQSKMAVTTGGERIQDFISIIFNKGNVAEGAVVEKLPGNCDLQNDQKYTIPEDEPTRDDGYEFIGYTLTTKQEKTPVETEIVDVAKNEIIFYYEEIPVQYCSYTVRYIDIDTWQPLIDDNCFTGVEAGTIVTELAREIDGYTPLEYEIQFEVEDKGVYIFLYYYAFDENF